MKRSLEKDTCRFYMDSFESYKDILKAIRKSGYETKDIFGMTGPGLICDIPNENDNNDYKNDDKMRVGRQFKMPLNLNTDYTTA